jgi:hypothetical protein
LAFARFFRACACFRSSSFETLNMMRTALSTHSVSVLPGTCGAGEVFMFSLYYVHLAIVEAKSLLIQISKQVEGLNAHVRTVNTTLEQAPVVLHAVGLDLTIHISDRMIDYRVLEFVPPNIVRRLQKWPVWSLLNRQRAP